jgi:ribosomal protein S4
VKLKSNKKLLPDSVKTVKKQKKLASSRQLPWLNSKALLKLMNSKKMSAIKSVSAWQRPLTQSTRTRLLFFFARRKRTKAEKDRRRRLFPLWKQGLVTGVDRLLFRNVNEVYDLTAQELTQVFPKRGPSRARQLFVFSSRGNNKIKFPGAGYTKHRFNNIVRTQVETRLPFVLRRSLTLKRFYTHAYKTFLDKANQRLHWAKHSRRLSPSPLGWGYKAPLARTQKPRRLQPCSYDARLSGNVEALLELALIRKYFERRARDLRLFTQPRKLPMRRRLPFWKIRKLGWRNDHAILAQVFSLPDGNNYTAPKTGGWTTDNKFVLRAWTKGPRTQLTTAFGEFLKDSKKYIQHPFLIKAIAAEKAQLNKHTALQPLEFPAETILTPLHFNKHTTFVYATDAEKMQWHRFQQDVTRRSYRALTEWSDSITSLYPRLMRTLAAETLSEKTEFYQSGAQLLKARYWSLRLYAQFRSLWHRPLLKYKSSAARRLLLRTEVGTAAEARYFPLSFTRVGRFRFQEHNLHQQASLKKGMLDWYHKFLPQYYILLQEDHEKYEPLELTPLKVQRAHPCHKAVIKWDTRGLGPLLDKRYDRLTSSEVSWKSPRFENMLLTTRRSPIYPGAAAAAAVSITVPGRLPTVQQNFFKRGFSTHTVDKVTPRNSTVRKLTELLSRKRRFSDTVAGDLTDSAAVQIHRQVKNRIIARARHEEFTAPSGVGVGGLDLRLLRGRSPRSADYYNRTHSPKQARSSFPANLQSAGYNPVRNVQSAESAIKTFRNEVLARRIPAPRVIYRQEAAKKKMQHTQHRIFLKRKHRRFVGKYNSRHFFNLLETAGDYVNELDFLSKTVRNCSGAASATVLPQTVLHTRTASQRTVFKYHPAQPHIASELFAGTARAWRAPKVNFPAQALNGYRMKASRWNFQRSTLTQQYRRKYLAQQKAAADASKKQRPASTKKQVSPAKAKHINKNQRATLGNQKRLFSTSTAPAVDNKASRPKRARKQHNRVQNTEAKPETTRLAATDVVVIETPNKAIKGATPQNEMPKPQARKDKPKNKATMPRRRWPVVPTVPGVILQPNTKVLVPPVVVKTKLEKTESRLEVAKTKSAEAKLKEIKTKQNMRTFVAPGVVVVNPQNTFLNRPKPQKVVVKRRKTRKSVPVVVKPWVPFRSILRWRYRKFGKVRMKMLPRRKTLLAKAFAVKRYKILHRLFELSKKQNKFNKLNKSRKLNKRFTLSKQFKVNRLTKPSKRPVQTKRRKQAKANKHVQSKQYKQYAPRRSTQKIWILRNRRQQKALHARVTRKVAAFRARRQILLTKKQMHVDLSVIKSNNARIQRLRKRADFYGRLMDRRGRRALLDKRRPHLWYKTTSFRMKKFRVVRQWLKFYNYAIKQKSWADRNIGRIIPDVLYKLARIRLRKLEWRESDEHFMRDELRHAFTFSPKERRAAPWFEAIMLPRALYSFQRQEYRRYQLPKDYKSNKWLQRFRKSMCRHKPSHNYIRGRHWPKLHRWSQWMHRSAFQLRNSTAALKRVRKLTKKKPVDSGFQRLMLGYGDRLDVNLMLLNIAPTTFWARELSPLGLLSVNGKPIVDAGYRFRAGDMITFNWGKIKRIQVLFKSVLKRYDKDHVLRNTSLHFPTNFKYYSQIRMARYLRLPTRDDLPANGRINEQKFRFDQLDSGFGRY